MAVGIAVLLVATLAPPPAQGASAAGVGLGVNVDGASTMKAAGATPAYATFWVGAWMATSGWGGLDGALATAKGSGATPLVYWYYWGDSISPTCVESGCNGLSRAQWDAMTATLVQHLQSDLGGAPVVVVLENEFNKNGVDSPSYAPTFDGYLAAKIAALRQVPNVHVVLGFGGWGEGNWPLFPKAIAASDTLGFQTMRASTKDTVASYTGAPDRIGQLVAAAKSAGGKGSFLYDLALSSYPDATWAAYQNQTLAAILARAPTWGASGLAGIVYREIDDNPGMSPANYYGYAEQHWGLRDGSGSPKPAWSTWLAAGAAAPATPAAPAAPPSPNVPGSFEAESMTASTGGPASDPTASGGALWNLWSNGTLTQSLVSTGGSYALAIAARGTPALGVYPTMQVSLDGALVGTATVGANLSSFAFALTLANGTSTLAIAFTNDLRTSNEDRNLLVDVARVAPPDRAPVPALAISGANLSWSFDARASTDPDGDALTFSWDFGDGATATGPTATHAYATAGAYAVTLAVSDGQLTSRANATVNAQYPPPVARFNASGANLTWSFDASASTGYAPGGLTYAWSFGDGTTGTGARATHGYAAAGTYTVRLTVSDAASSTASQSVAPTAPPPPPPPPAPAPFAANFSTKGGNAWWIATSVAANAPLAGVCASVNGSACQPLKLQSWGEWAASFYVPPTARVVFVATSASGQSATSIAYSWPTGAPYFDASFSGVSGNNWWVQASVSANQTLASVCASVNGGACQALKLQSWGAWAASFNVPTGAKVVFRATSASGQTATSAAYAWSSKVG